jgi:uncharacterized membrane protein
VTRIDGIDRLVAGWLMLALASALTGSMALRVVTWFPVALYLPGRLYLAAFGVKTNGFAEQTLLAVCLSLCNLVAGGFVLGVMHALTPLGWGLWLAATSALLLLRALSTPPTAPIAEGRGTHPSPAPAPLHLAALALAAVGVVIAFGVAIRDEAADRQFLFTEFWMVPAEGNSHAVAIGLRNAEGRSTKYEMEVLLDRAAFVSTPVFEVADGAKTVKSFVIPPLAPGSHKLEARLFKDGARDNLYRRVFLNLDSSGGSR